MSLEVIVTVSRGELTVVSDNPLCLSTDCVTLRSGFLLLMSGQSILMRTPLPSAVSETCAEVKTANIICMKNGMPCGLIKTTCHVTL